MNDAATDSSTPATSNDIPLSTQPSTTQTSTTGSGDVDDVMMDLSGPQGKKKRSLETNAPQDLTESDKGEGTAAKKVRLVEVSDASFKEIEKLRFQIAAQQTSLSVAQNKSQALQEQISELESDKKEMREKIFKQRKTIDSFSKLNSESKERIEKLETEMEAMKAVNVHPESAETTTEAEYSTKIRELEVIIGELEQDKRDLEMNIMNPEQQTDEDHQEKVPRTKDDLHAQTENELTRVRDDLKCAEDKIKVLEGNVESHAQTENELARVRGDLKRAEDKVKVLEGTVESHTQSENELTSIRGDLKRAEDKIKVLEGNVEVSIAHSSASFDHLC
ncbi:hypothetical protein EV360DRAFT_83113 [Lentinula raphanica]|nr:hypothetical protein EV360DRAFT_83113 [Lentinula raphanica]